MQVATTYQIASQRYPKQVEEIVAKINSGKSKIVGTDPETWKWYFSWGMVVGGLTRGPEALKEIIANAQKSEEEREAEWRADKERTVEERLQDQVSRARVSICGGGRSTFGVQIDEVPPEILEVMRDSAEKSWIRDQELLAMTPEERHARAQAALAQLAGTPGFAAFRLVPKE